MSKTIFITGASRGFGKIWTEAFLRRGDKVAATVRDLNALKDLAKQFPDTLLPLKLDVTNQEFLPGSQMKFLAFLKLR